MKRLIFLIAIALLILIDCKKDEIIFESNCYPESLRQGVIASYSFKNGSLLNETSSNADLSVFGNAVPTSDRDGNPNCAYVFNRLYGEYLSTNNTGFLNGLKAFSISLWYEPMDSTFNGGSFEVLMSRNDSQVRCPDRRGEWSVGLYDCRRAVFGHNNSVWSGPLPLPPASCLDLVYFLTGSWRHVVAVYNNDTYKIYENAVLQDSVSGVGTCTNLHLAEDKGDLFIGKYYTGKIDDILIYNREITSQEVLDLYNTNPCCL